MADEHKPRLGRGLAALLGDAAEERFVPREPGAPPRLVPIERLRPNSRNPRKSFSDEQLEELTRSIRERGVLQPIIVRPIPGDAHSYEIVAGERRWRAAQKAGVHEVPVFKVEADDKEALEIAIVENVQRTDLNALEEAQGYQRLIQEFSYTQNDLGKVIGKSRSHIANTIRLTKLPEKTLSLLADGRISAGHARALLAVSDPDAVAQEILKKGLSVRDVELLGESASNPRKAARSSESASKDPETRAVEKALADALGMVVTLHTKGTGGDLRIRFENLEQLDFLCNRLKASP